MKNETSAPQYQKFFLVENWALVFSYNKYDEDSVFCINFRILDVLFKDDNQPVYRDVEDFPTKDDKNAEVIVEGFIKHDGCCQWSAKLVHTDSLEEMLNFNRVLALIYKKATDIFSCKG